MNKDHTTEFIAAETTQIISAFWSGNAEDYTQYYADDISFTDEYGNGSGLKRMTELMSERTAGRSFVIDGMQMNVTVNNGIYILTGKYNICENQKIIKTYRMYAVWLNNNGLKLAVLDFLLRADSMDFRINVY
ncbi:MAG: hypothetical protein K6D03_04005 [Solobacterium sp.]|nr:hypothetical protein [Solobacterium sp.]